ncbi:MAG: endonuclease III [Caulobacteraceae bacterium]
MPKVSLAPATTAPTRKAKPGPRVPPLKAAERERIAAIFTRFAELNPDPRGELDYLNPYTFLVAVALSAQATDKSVNKATGPLFPIADTPRKMLELGVDELEGYIRTIGLYRTKAKNVIAAAQILVDRYGGEVPLEREALQSLPGVGRKTASVVLNQLGIEPAIAVDTHVFRVSHRMNLSKASTPDGVERDLMARVPETYRTRAHHWLILHGRYICVARKPKCGICPVNDLCPSRSLFMGA